MRHVITRVIKVDPQMYICGLIPRKLAKLAEVAPNEFYPSVIGLPKEMGFATRLRSYSYHQYFFLL